MKKVFLATSFSDKVDPATGEVLPEFKKFIEQVLEELRADGVEVFAAVEDEKWRMATDEDSPELGVQHDLAQLDESDVLLALVQDQPSAGLQFELGYAVAKGKQVILARQANDQLAHFNQGIVSSGLVTLVSYDNLAMLIPQLTVAINAPAD